jgi:Domain of unknown function (DUF6438)
MMNGAYGSLSMIDTRQLIKHGAIFTVTGCLTACSFLQQPFSVRTSHPFATRTPFQSIIKERAVCSVSCNSDKITIIANGDVSYQSKEYSKVKVNGKALLTQSQIQTLEEAITKVKFFSLKSRYIDEKDGCTALGYDFPYITITISSVKQTKSINYYLGCQGQVDLKQLTLFEDTLNEVVNSDQLFKKSKSSIE